jgi:deoxyribodipyrimidine photo-lyase
MSELSRRATALARWQAFLPRAGADYARDRNTDPADERVSGVSGLSPAVRHRLVSEAELALGAHSAHGMAAEKFVQEVCWRTYWKGWLEQRPGVWTDYRAALDRHAAQRRLPDLLRAERGETGIDCFDHWARQLETTGYLHNHARMWTASIWIFTLRLPWALGADWFMRHLLDADAAANTLSWRWVAGLHTQGKHYLARADNIARYTEGRFCPRGALNEQADSLPWQPPPEPQAIPQPAPLQAALPSGWLLHLDDLDGDGALMQALRGRVDAPPRAVAVLDTVPGDAISPVVTAFQQHVLDGLELTRLTPEAVPEWTTQHGIRQVVMPYLPAGPLRDRLTPYLDRWQGDGLAVTTLLRDWDADFWPHARRGFFQLKQRIPDILARMT